ncbi:MAG: ribosome small subunit-dependent GTPase A [Christensenellaceae bacterium]|nr:ribosome small subunit-dependent GTPase A [Christensenellaceae bacterium]
MQNKTDECCQNGRILKGIGGFYYVQLADGSVVECRARGKFRLDGQKPMPGDFVSILPPSDTQGGFVEEICPRKNQLTRPMVANVDQLLIVVSAKKPKADLLLVDKLLLYAVWQGIPAVLAVNKVDTGGDTLECVRREYAASGIEVLAVSAKTGEGLKELREVLQNKNTCLAGQSAVGKSSLLNALQPDLALATGGLSKKTDRGRHTTRHSELMALPDLEATVVDTPGFSILECMDVQPEELKDLYPEYLGANCRFDGCLHYREPDCGVKEKVARGELSEERHGRYIQILEELLERRKKQYD